MEHKHRHVIYIPPWLQFTFQWKQLSRTKWNWDWKWLVACSLLPAESNSLIHFIRYSYDECGDRCCAVDQDAIYIVEHVNIFHAISHQQHGRIGLDPALKHLLFPFYYVNINGIPLFGVCTLYVLLCASACVRSENLTSVLLIHDSICNTNKTFVTKQL